MAELKAPAMIPASRKSIYLQGIVLNDPKANTLGVALSNAGKATIGF